MSERKAVAILVVDLIKKKILAVKRVSKDDVFGGMWALPGGSVEEGETFFEAARREIKEETGVDLVFLESEPLTSSILKLGSDQATIYLFRGEVAGDCFSPQDPEIEKVAWIAPQELLASLEEYNYPPEEIEKISQFFKRFEEE